jgi:hypothetical protein
MNEPQQSFSELIKDLEARGVTKEHIEHSLEQAAERRERGEVLDFDPLDAISTKLDKLQESVDALTAKLDR